MPETIGDVFGGIYASAPFQPEEPLVGGTLVQRSVSPFVRTCLHVVEVVPYPFVDMLQAGVQGHFEGRVLFVQMVCEREEGVHVVALAQEEETIYPEIVIYQEINHFRRQLLADVGSQER